MGWLSVLSCVAQAGTALAAWWYGVLHSPTAFRRHTYRRMPVLRLELLLPTF